MHVHIGSTTTGGSCYNIIDTAHSHTDNCYTYQKYLASPSYLEYCSGCGKSYSDHYWACHKCSWTGFSRTSNCTCGKNPYINEPSHSCKDLTCGETEGTTWKLSCGKSEGYQCGKSTSTIEGYSASYGGTNYIITSFNGQTVTSTSNQAGISNANGHAYLEYSN